MKEAIRFELEDEEYYAIEIACNTARALLKRPQIKPRQVIGLGNALFALERLPETTEGVCCEFGLTYRSGNEMRYINFRISDEEFEISKGSSVYDCSIGGDNYSTTICRIEFGGYRENSNLLYDIESRIGEYINIGAEITVDDESEIEHESE